MPVYIDTARGVFSILPPIFMRDMLFRAALLTPLLLSACHRWVPLETTPAVGTEVEAVLTEEGTASLTGVIGPRVQTLQGSVAGSSGDTLRISLREITTRDGQALFLHGMTLDLHRPFASQLRMQVVDRRRTVVAVALTVVGSAALIQAVRSGGLAGGSGDGGGGTPALRQR